MFAEHNATKAPQALHPPASVKAVSAASELLCITNALVTALLSTVSQPWLSRLLFAFLRQEEKKETLRETCNQRER